MDSSEYLGSEYLDRALIECGAVRFGEFKLTSGRISDYYVDVKLASTRPAILGQIAAGMRDIIASEFGDADLLSGMELGAVPIAAAAALATDIDYLIVRKAPKGHGTGGQIEGSWKEGAGVVILEDVTTTGGSVLRSAEVLAAADLRVLGAVTVVDREEGATALMEENGIEFRALTTATSVKSRRDDL